ncbi:MAG TPA: hypothetical protein VF982_01130, partial [Anaerolineales bacterium]
YLQTNLSPPIVAPGGTASLTIIDNHTAGELIPGLFSTLTVHADDGSRQLEGELIVLVGGRQIVLPFSAR